VDSVASAAHATRLLQLLQQSARVRPPVTQLADLLALAYEKDGGGSSARGVDVWKWMAPAPPAVGVFFFWYMAVATVATVGAMMGP